MVRPLAVSRDDTITVARTDLRTVTYNRQWLDLTDVPWLDVVYAGVDLRITMPAITEQLWRIPKAISRIAPPGGP